jgi:hypothetical protein
MQISIWRWLKVATLVTVLMTATWTFRILASQRTVAPAPVAGRTGAPLQPVMPQYDKSGALILPEDYRRWIMVGGSLGISYTEMPGEHEMFAHTLMEPTAYQSFIETGKFREGTMLALVLQGKGEKVLPARRGQFASDVHGVEMAVKDSSHSPDGWSYYAFGGMGSITPTAKAAPKASCYNCHAEHAARDHVFLQFYPLLSEAAGPNLGR